MSCVCGFSVCSHLFQEAFGLKRNPCICLMAVHLLSLRELRVSVLKSFWRLSNTPVRAVTMRVCSSVFCYVFCPSVSPLALEIE